MFKVPIPVLEVVLQQTARSRLEKFVTSEHDPGKHLLDFLSDNYEGHDTRDIVAMLYWVSLFLVESSLGDVLSQLDDDNPLKQGAMKELAMLNLIDPTTGEEK